MAQISIAAGTGASVTLAAGARLLLSGQGTYRVGPLGASQRPTVDEQIDVTSVIGPFSDSCTIQLWASGAGATYEVALPTDAVDSTGRPISGAGGALPPGPPRSVRALAGNGSATVYWEASTSSLPASYVITASSGASVSVAATARVQSAIFSGLANGVSVSFTVQAVNAAGTSVASDPSNSVTPTSLPSATLPVTDGLLAWYDTILQPSLPSNGSELASWTDLSGNGFNLARAGGAGTGGTVVASWSGGKPAIQLNGSTQYYTAAGLILGAYGPNQTVLVVGDVQSNAGAGRMVSNETTAVINSDSVFYLGFTGAGPTTPSVKSGYPSPVSAPTVVLSTAFDAIVTTPGQLYINGVPVATPIDPVTRSPSGTLSIGAQNGGINASTLACRIATVIVFNRVLSAAEIASMRTFLATRR